MRRYAVYFTVCLLSCTVTQRAPGQSPVQSATTVAGAAVVEFATQPTATLVEEASPAVPLIDVPLDDYVVPTVPQGACRSQCHRRGCQLCSPAYPHHHKSYWGHSAYYRPTPFGASVCAVVQMQIGNAQASRLTLYKYDFYAEQDARSAQLNPGGLARVRQLAPLFAQSGLPLIVEPTRHGPALDDARREAARAELARLLGTTIELDQVVVALPQAHGMSGVEAVVPFANMLKRTQSEQVPRSTAGSFKPATN